MGPQRNQHDVSKGTSNNIQKTVVIKFFPIVFAVEMFPDRVSRMDGAVVSFFTSQYCCPALIHRGYGKGFVLFP